MLCVPPKTCALDRAGGRRLLKRLKPRALRLSALFTQTFLLVGFVLLVVAVKKCPLRIAFASEDVRGNAVQKPAVMADDHDAAGEFQ